ncbi:hypothetical protein BC567DRAFT_89425 [Phyllosticta citribraziliensis]
MVDGGRIVGDETQRDGRAGEDLARHVKGGISSSLSGASWRRFERLRSQEGIGRRWPRPDGRQVGVMMRGERDSGSQKQYGVSVIRLMSRVSGESTRWRLQRCREQASRACASCRLDAVASGVWTSLSTGDGSLRQPGPGSGSGSAHGECSSDGRGRGRDRSWKGEGAGESAGLERSRPEESTMKREESSRECDGVESQSLRHSASQTGREHGPPHRCARREGPCFSPGSWREASGPATPRTRTRTLIGPIRQDPATQRPPMPMPMPMPSGLLPTTASFI